jgi:hypothetical protein
MAHFYRERGPAAETIWVYSERGVLSYAFLHALPEDPSPVLDRAVNGDGITLGQVIGTKSGHVCLGEFDLGNQWGFGCPDGGLLFSRPASAPVFVFVEAKVVPWVVSSQEARSYTAEQLAKIEEKELDALCRNNTFNSSINGQLELRWRFANAVRNAAEAGKTIVTEQSKSNPPPAEIIATDRFYWRRRLTPDANVDRDWRHLHMTGGLQPLREKLGQVGDNFYLLAVTLDRDRPNFDSVRLFDRTGTPLPDRNARLFWMSFSHFSELLTPMV